MVEAEERGGGRARVGGVGGETAVGGAVCEDGGWGGEAVDFDADEGEGSPAGEGPGSDEVEVSDVGCDRWILVGGMDGIVSGRDTGGAYTYIPHNETRIVAKRTERTNGASIIAPANTKCENIQAVRRSGLYLFMVLTKGAILGGGRGVKPGFSSSGDLTIHGKRTEPSKVTIEKTTSERLPMRPMSPKASEDSCADLGAS